MKSIKKNGFRVSFERHTEGAYDPDTNEYKFESREYTGYAVQMNYSIKNIDGTVIKQGDTNLMCYFNEEPPKVDEELKLPSGMVTVVNITPFVPDGVNILYWDIQAR